MASEQVAIARRASAVGCVASERTPGSLVRCVWPGDGLPGQVTGGASSNAFREQLQIEPGLTFSVGTMLPSTEVTFDNEQSRGNVFGRTTSFPMAMARGDLRYPVRRTAQPKAREACACNRAESLRWHQRDHPVLQKPITHAAPTGNVDGAPLFGGGYQAWGR